MVGRSGKIGERVTPVTAIARSLSAANLRRSMGGTVVDRHRDVPAEEVGMRGAAAAIGRRG